jgi:hypothetical protein
MTLPTWILPMMLGAIVGLIIGALARHRTHAHGPRGGRPTNSPRMEIRLVTTLKDSQKVILSATITDKQGQPAQVQNPAWKSTDETVAIVKPSDDGLSALVIAKGPGTCQINMDGDADLGDGVTEVDAPPYDITVTAGDATTIVLSAGAVAEQDGSE